jgi:predicted alpha/beta superfamily hydrolase
MAVLSPRIQTLERFYSPAEGFHRTVRVFLPEWPGRAPDARFGVIYAQDGQNLFAAAPPEHGRIWAADLVLEALLRAGEVEPWMIVAIDHGIGRFEEYSLWEEPLVGAAGKGDRYLRFLVETLKPFIDRTFPTLPSREMTAVMGSSLGGLSALASAWSRPDVFGRVVAMSPSVMWARKAIFQSWKERTRLPLRIYLDAGAEEWFEAGDLKMDYGNAVRSFSEHLSGLGYGEKELKVVLEPGGAHSETDWRRRLPEALRWALTAWPG